MEHWQPSTAQCITVKYCLQVLSLLWCPNIGQSMLISVVDVIFIISSLSMHGQYGEQ